MRGLHVHVGSQILDVEPFAQSVAPVAALGEFPVYDLGGGLGARYTYDDQPPSVGDYLDALIGAAREHLPAEAELIIEPGPQHGRVRGGDALPRRHRQARRRSRSSPSTAAWATTSRWRCSTSASRPASRTGSTPAGGEDGHASSAATARAATCSSTASRLDAPRVGDLLAVPATGAYCFTMANNYNGNRRIPVVFAADGEAPARGAPRDLGGPARPRRRLSDRGGGERWHRLTRADPAAQARRRRWRRRPAPTPRRGRARAHDRALPALAVRHRRHDRHRHLHRAHARPCRSAGPAVILSFVFAGVVAGLTAICYAELASAVPVSGSSYSYAYATLGEGVAMVVAACLLLEYGVSAAAVAVGWSQYLNELLDNLFGFTIPESLVEGARSRAASSTCPRWS